MIYFTSDTHFFHENCISLANRPFQNLEEMHRMLIDNWNRRVQPEDEIYILGDFAYRAPSVEHIHTVLKQLNGKKYMLIGNHDYYLRNPDFDLSYFEWVKEYESIYYNCQKIVMFHYPILEWDGFYKKAIHLYGHIHQSTRVNLGYNAIPILGQRAINVSVEFQNYAPISVEEVLLQTGVV